MTARGGELPPTVAQAAAQRLRDAINQNEGDWREWIDGYDLRLIISEILAPSSVPRSSWTLLSPGGTPLCSRAQCLNEAGGFNGEECGEHEDET